jgi:hypothetical protein
MLIHFKIDDVIFLCLINFLLVLFYNKRRFLACIMFEALSYCVVPAMGSNTDHIEGGTLCPCTIVRWIFGDSRD